MYGEITPADKKIDAAIVDKALANVSDMPSVSQDYNTGRDYRQRGFGFRVESGYVGDLVTFMFAIRRADADLADALHEALSEERSYTGTTYFFPGFALVGRSEYDNGDSDPIDYEDDADEDDEVSA